ncbi:MAG: CCA tRNA nucleotidyltransferase [Deltaproteobacteria bacterium]|nr:CCA tRNA nucleotidyltransferase [Deltaproteobacteria bacterium]
MAELPEALIELFARLDARGQRAWLVGESLHDLRLGLPLRAWELTTTAPAGDLFEAFPHAVSIDPERGVVMVPTAAGPVDLAPLRFGPSPADDLARRDFSVLAMALDPLSGTLLDPYSGERDREHRLLRGVGSARERLGEDPLRALRAARLVAEQGYRVDAELAEAMEEVAPQLETVAPYRLRGELSRLLLADGCREGLELIRRTGIEGVLLQATGKGMGKGAGKGMGKGAGEGVGKDAAALAAAMPAKLGIRLAAWLRGAGAAAFLRKLRFGKPLSPEVLLRLDHHPIDSAVRPSNDPAVRRLLGRLDAQTLEELFALREAELRLSGSTSAERGLAALRAAIERVSSNAERTRRREALAIGGREVMEALGSGPGHRVGEALRFLGERVSDDPACNERERLQALLQEWLRAHPD